MTMKANIEGQIIVIRGHRVMLDRDLARIYGVPTKRLNEQVKRNRHRFPRDFMFRITMKEAKQLSGSRSQFATLNQGQNVKHAPYVFTEHGAIMLASILNSTVAVRASVHVVRAFVKMRTSLAEYTALARRLDKLEAEYDGRFSAVFVAIRNLMRVPAKPKRAIGFLEPGKPEGKKQSRETN
jgi:hypothetical protein